MKSILIKVAVGVLVIGILFLTVRNCRIDYKYAEIKIKYEQLKKQVETLEQTSLAEITEHESTIAKLSESIANKEKIVSDIYTQIADKNKQIKKLESSLNTPDKDETIANLNQQVGLWKEKFGLAENIIAEKDGIIFDLTAKYDAQVKISLEYKSMWEGEKGLRILGDQKFSLAEKQIKGLKFSSKVKTIAVAVVGGVLIYSLIK